jgi:RNA polymerase sigma factor (TIGR02999 family)
MSDVTGMLARIQTGDRGAADELLPLVYGELRSLAAARMTHEEPGQTLQATALVHEAYLRLVDGPQADRWDSRGHFFAVAAEAMRRILIERARARATAKRGGDRQRVELDDLVAAQPEEDLPALDEALTELEKHDSLAAGLVKLRYFAGMSHQEAAAALGITRRAADRLWALAKAWLYQQLRRD